MRLTTSGVAGNFAGGIVGVVTKSDLPDHPRENRIRLLDSSTTAVGDSLIGYRCVLSEGKLDLAPTIPYIHRIRETDHLSEGDIVALEAKTGLVRSLYRPYERHHHLFATERCNSNCLMCSQPPKDMDDVGALTERNRDLIRLINPHPNYLTITGGEPTLLGDNLFDLIRQLRDEMAATEIHILTNGRTFAWPEYARRFAQIGHPNISLGSHSTQTLLAATTTWYKHAGHSIRQLLACIKRLAMASA